MITISLKPASHNLIKCQSIKLLPLTFSGIAIYEPKLFSELTEGDKIKLAPILEIAINKKCIQGELFDGLWSDVGTPERLNMINLDKWRHEGL